MKNLSLFCFLYLLSLTAHSQAFNSTSGPVPDNSCTAANVFPIEVSGVGVLGTTMAFSQIEINILMDYDSDLNISLISPTGVEVALAYGEGADGDNFTHTVFRADATMTLSQGSAPFTGAFLPSGDLKAFKSVQADGTWKLRICDLGPGNTATLESAALSFAPYTAPTCEAPLFVYSANITASSVHFLWDSLDKAADYYYVLDNSPANPTVPGTLLKATDFFATNLAPETSYYFHVRIDCGSVLGSSSWVTANFKSPPINDNCADAIAITALPYTKTQDILGANYVDSYVMNCGDGMNDGAWYAFSVANAGHLQIDLTNISGWNPEIALFKGGCGNFTCVASADENGLRGSESIDIPNLEAGQYYINIGDGSGTLNNLEGRFTISLSGTASLNLLGTDTFDKSAFSFYPNPVKNKLNLDYHLNISDVAIFNLLGQQVLAKTINSVNTQLDLSALSSGTYVVKVAADDQVQLFKVFKE